MCEKCFAECFDHGRQEAAFVCRHLIDAMSSGAPVGFYCAEDPGATCPDAWCGKCEDARAECGWEWIEEVENGLGITMICVACYEKVRGICLAPSSSS